MYDAIILFFYGYGLCVFVVDREETRCVRTYIMHVFRDWRAGGERVADQLAYLAVVREGVYRNSEEGREREDFFPL